MRQIIKHLSGNGVKILSFGFDVDEETQLKRMKSRDTSTVLVKKKLQLVLMLIKNLIKYLKKRIYLNTSTLMMKKRKISLLIFTIH